MDNQDNLISEKTLLPAIVEQNKKIDELARMLAQMQKPVNNAPIDPMFLDYRKIDAFMELQNMYYNIFAKNTVSLEYVPYDLIQKSTKWATKQFKRDLKKQVNNKYKKLIKKERAEKRRTIVKKFFARLFSPIKNFFAIFLNLAKKFFRLFKKKPKSSTSTKLEN